MKRIKRILTFLRENRIIITLSALIVGVLHYLGLSAMPNFWVITLPTFFLMLGFNKGIKRKEIEFLNWWAFRQAIKEAKKKYYKSTLRGTRPGKRYLVIQKTDGKLAVVDNTFINHYNKIVAKKGGKKITIKDLIEMSFYSIG